jgi:AraC-like DNA-binding protein
MSRIIFGNEYVIVVPSFEDVAPHKHDFFHIFFLGQNEECDEIYVTGSGMLHTMPNSEECKLFLMIDPTSDLADHIQNCILEDDLPKRIKVKKAFRYTEDAAEESLKESLDIWLTDNGFQSCKDVNETIEDYRIVKLIHEIRDYKHLEKRINEIAAEYNLSDSRLSHVFKECVGVSLKGYLMIAQLKYAYELVLEGKSKTYASLEAGFSSPAHLAYICKKQMGISISDVLK